VNKGEYKIGRAYTIVQCLRPTSTLSRVCQQTEQSDITESDIAKYIIVIIIYLFIYFRQQGR